MNFIKSDDGRRINLAHVRQFRIGVDGRIYAIFGLIVRSDGVVLGNDEIAVTDRKSRADAELWLDEHLTEATK